MTVSAYNRLSNRNRGVTGKRRKTISNNNQCKQIYKLSCISDFKNKELKS